MTIFDRQQLAKDVQQAEGFSKTAYRDSVGVWTIGYGTNLQALVIEESLAATWLARGLAQAERELERFPWYAGLTTARQRACVEMVYNLGLSRFLGFEQMIQALKNGAYTTAAAEALDSQWARQVGPIRSGRIAALLRG